MNHVLSNIIDNDVEHTPKVNEVLKNGLGKYQLDKAIDIISEGIVSSMKGATPELTFDGVKKLTPEQTLDLLYKEGKSGSTPFDISKSTIYMVDLGFKWEGEPLYAYTHLPFVKDGSIMTLSDTKYVTSGVVTDSVLTVGQNSILIKTLQGKITIQSLPYQYFLNGNRELYNIPYSERILNHEQKTNKSVMVSPLILYRLATKGLSSFGDIQIRFKEDASLDSTYDCYSLDSLTIKSLKTNDDWARTRPENRMRVYVNKKHKKDLSTRAVAVAMLYVYQHEMEEFSELLDLLNTPAELDLWSFLIGKCVYRDKKTTGDILAIMEAHFITLNFRLDTIHNKRLKGIGIEVDDYYDLLGYVAINYNYMLDKGVEISQDIHKKYLETAYYILYPILVTINRFINNITKKANKSKSPLSLKSVKNYIQNDIRRRTVFSLISGSVNITMSACDSSNDSKYLKLLSVLTMQNQAQGVDHARTRGMANQFKTLHAVDSLVGSIGYLPKKTPSPLFRQNLFLDIDPDTGRFLFTEEELDVLNKIEIMLRSEVIDTESIELSALDTEL